MPKDKTKRLHLNFKLTDPSQWIEAKNKIEKELGFALQNGAIFDIILKQFNKEKEE